MSTDKPVPRTYEPHGRDVATTRYIGSKARVVDAILDVVGEPMWASVFVDAFAGTGVVASAAADRGWTVRINDHLRSSAVVTLARLLSVDDVPFEGLGGYDKAVASLNASDGSQGFFVREYSPASGAGRKYFTEGNAARIDSMREQIANWSKAGVLLDRERDLLIADLIGAAARVANTAGTYGCFLTHWTRNALRPITLEARSLRATPVAHELHVGDVLDVPLAEADVAYFDPPYSKRQYAAYYHINETLSQGDEPEVCGKTGLRPWRQLASDYCYKARALSAITELIQAAPARRVLLSYSSDGHVPLSGLVDALEPLGDLHTHELASIARYRPNSGASAGGEQVVEYLLELFKSPVITEREPELA